MKSDNQTHTCSVARQLSPNIDTVHKNPENRTSFTTALRNLQTHIQSISQDDWQPKMGILERHTPCQFTLKEEKKQVTEREKEIHSLSFSVVESVVAQWDFWTVLTKNCTAGHRM